MYIAYSAYYYLTLKNPNLIYVAAMRFEMKKLFIFWSEHISSLPHMNYEPGKRPKDSKMV